MIVVYSLTLVILFAYASSVYGKISDLNTWANKDFEKNDDAGEQKGLVPIGEDKFPWPEPIIDQPDEPGFSTGQSKPLLNGVEWIMMIALLVAIIVTLRSNEYTGTLVTGTTSTVLAIFLGLGTLTVLYYILTKYVIVDPRYYMTTMVPVGLASFATFLIMYRTNNLVEVFNQSSRQIADRAPLAGILTILAIVLSVTAQKQIQTLSLMAFTVALVFSLIPSVSWQYSVGVYCLFIAGVLFS